MKIRFSKYLFVGLTFSMLIALPSKADFGDADFPVDIFKYGPKSYHDAWCKKINNKCRIRFQGPAMWVEGQGGIQLDQLIGFRFDKEKAKERGITYNYVAYRSSNGNYKEALFLFSRQEAQMNFLRSFLRWKKQTPVLIPNYRYPNSQGPQDTQGRDKGLNPYDNPPIDDWNIKTTEKGMRGKINCDSQVWKNRPQCK